MTVIEIEPETITPGAPDVEEVDDDDLEYDDSQPYPNREWDV